MTQGQAIILGIQVQQYHSTGTLYAWRKLPALRVKARTIQAADLYLGNRGDSKKGRHQIHRTSIFLTLHVPTMTSTALPLLRSLLREARHINDYNFRSYAVRRVKAGFDKNRDLVG